jgi:SET domain
MVARRESSYMRDMARERAFRIGRSRTGLGLFARMPIKKGAFIVEYKGRKLTNEQADKLEARGNRYLYEINSRWTIDGTSRKNLGRYANHSCRPNAETHTIGHKVINQEQNRCRDYLQLRPRLSDQRHHAAWLQMRQVPESTSRCPLEGTRQGPMSRTRCRRPMSLDSSRGSGWARP